MWLLLGVCYFLYIFRILRIWKFVYIPNNDIMDGWTNAWHTWRCVIWALINVCDAQQTKVILRPQYLLYGFSQLPYICQIVIAGNFYMNLPLTT